MASSERKAGLHVVVKIWIGFERRPCIGSVAAVASDPDLNLAMWIQGSLLSDGSRPLTRESQQDRKKASVSHLFLSVTVFTFPTDRSKTYE